MITVKATYFGFRTFFDTINLKGKEQKVFVKLHEFRDVTDDIGNIIAEKIEVKEAGTYENANLEKFKKYHITSSEVTKDKILRPSKCELIIEPDVDNEGIQDVVTLLKSGMLDYETYCKRMKEFSNTAMANYIKSVIDKSNK